MKNIILVLIAVLNLSVYAQEISIEQIRNKLKNPENISYSINEILTVEEMKIIMGYNNGLSPDYPNRSQSSDMIAYGNAEGLDHSYGFFTLNTPVNYTVLLPVVSFCYSGAIHPFNPEEAYVMNTVGQLFELDYETGLTTLLSSSMPFNILGMEFNPVDNKLYATDGDNLWTINTTDLTSDFIGFFNLQVMASGLAIDGEGNAYTVGFNNGGSFLIDLETAEATFLGSAGYDPSFLQGVSWDPVNDRILITSFDLGGSSSSSRQLRVLDVDTGATIPIGDIMTDSTLITWFSILGEGLDVEDFEDQAQFIQLKPNPAINEVSILTNNDIAIRNVEVFDSLGRKVACPLEGNTLNIALLSEGLYFVNLFTAQDQQQTLKLIKQ